MPCGDAASKADLKKLMAGELAAMVFTDLLYNVNYDDTAKDNLRAKAGRTILNDNLGDDFEGLLTEACQKMLRFTDPG